MVFSFSLLSFPFGKGGLGGLLSTKFALIHVACCIYPGTGGRAYHNVLKCTAPSLVEAFLGTSFKNAYNRQKKRLPKQTPKSKARDFTGA
jgi:hypothetical protein